MSERLGMPPFSGRYTCGRYLQALAINNNDSLSAIAYAEAQNWADKHQIIAALKSAQSPISTTDFPGALTPIGDSFLAAMADVSIPLRLQGLRRTPMLTRVYINSQGVVATRVAEGAPTPVLGGDWSATTLTPVKFAAITVVTDELARSASPTASLAISDDLARATAVAENDAFLNAGYSRLRAVRANWIQRSRLLARQHRQRFEAADCCGAGRVRS